MKYKKNDIKLFVDSSSVTINKALYNVDFYRSDFSKKKKEKISSRNFL